MLGLDRARVAITEFRLKPLPCPRPAVALFLLLGPDITLGDALGLTQRHGALVAIADTAFRITHQRGSGGRLALPGADLVPCAVQLDRALLIRKAGFRVAFAIEPRAARAQGDEPEAVRLHGSGRAPPPTALQVEKVPDPVLAQRVIRARGEGCLGHRSFSRASRSLGRPVKRDPGSP